MLPGKHPEGGGSAPTCSPPCGPAGCTTPFYPAPPARSFRLQQSRVPTVRGGGQNKGPPWNRTCLYQVGRRDQGEHKQRSDHELRATVGHRTRGQCGEGLQAFAAGFAQQGEGMVRPQTKLTDCRCWSPVTLDGSGIGLSAFPLQTPILHGVGDGGWGCIIHSRPQNLGSKSRIISSEILPSLRLSCFALF